MVCFRLRIRAYNGNWEVPGISTRDIGTALAVAPTFAPGWVLESRVVLGRIAMRKLLMPSLTAGLFLSSAPLWAITSPCDLNNDGVVNSADVQAAVNMTIGITTPCTANIAGAGVCNAIVVQRVVNASLGQSCLVSTGLHVVSLNWAASNSSGITGYQVSRGAASTGPFTLLATVGGTTLTYMDTTVVSGQTYYYVVAAVAGSTVSTNSSPTVAAVPTP